MTLKIRTHITPQIIESPPGILPSIAKIKKIHAQLKPYINDTPTIKLPIMNESLSLYAKFEIWQKSGSFKFRGALNSLLKLTDKEKKQGVIAISAGNHAIAVAHACALMKIKASVIMPKSVDKLKIKICKAHGASVTLGEDIPKCFTLLEKIQEKQHYSLIHPFEGIAITEGTATIGLELYQQSPKLDAVVVAVGGGGLISGVGHAIKQLNPSCKVYGVEPTTANVMTKSFQRGQPSAATPSGIVYSLHAPEAQQLSYATCTNVVDGIVNIHDQDTQKAMDLVYNKLNLAIEPAAVISLAAINGPLKATLKGKKVGIIFCGSNVSIGEYTQLRTKAIT